MYRRCGKGNKLLYRLLLAHILPVVGLDATHLQHALRRFNGIGRNTTLEFRVSPMGRLDATPDRGSLSREVRERMTKVGTAALKEAYHRYMTIKPILEGTTSTDNTSLGRKIRRWVATYRQAERDLSCGYVGLLSDYYKCGNCLPLLSEPTINALNEFIEKEYEQHKQKNKREVYGELFTFCKTQKGLISAPGYKTFVAVINRRPRDVQVKKRADHRTAYSHEPRYLELSYTLPRHGDRPFEVVHIDHTELDVTLVDSLTDCGCCAIPREEVLFQQFDRGNAASCKKENVGGLFYNSCCVLIGLDACVMDFDDAWAGPKAELENKGKKELSLNPPQDMHPSLSKSLPSIEKIQPLSLANELPTLELVSTLPPVTIIKPPPTIFTDLWKDSDDPSSVPDEALLTSMLNPHQTGEEHQNMLISEEKSKVTLPLELDSMPDELWKNEVPISEEASEDWAEYATSSFDDLSVFEDLDLFDIDVVLEKQEEVLQLQEHKRGRGTSTWRQRLERWGGGVHVNWDNAETAEWRVLERLGYTRVPLSKETRDYIIQAARNAKLPHWQKVQLTTQLVNARAQLALLPPLNEEERGDPYAARRQALQAEITEVEQMLACKMQWMIIKKAVQFLGQDIELDDLMMRDNYFVRW